MDLKANFIYFREGELSSKQRLLTLQFFLIHKIKLETSILISTYIDARNGLQKLGVIRVKWDVGIFSNQFHIFNGEDKRIGLMYLHWGTPKILIKG